MELGRRKADRDKLVITEIPYTMIGAGINKFLSDVAELVESRKLPDVVDISNQSSKEGIHIVLELKKDADVNKIRNILYKKTKLEDTYGVNMLAIDDGRPETMNLKQILNTFLEFQYKNMTKKYNVLLEKELEKKEVQEGLIGACDVIDVIIAILRGSRNLKDAKECLMTGNTANIKFRSPGFEEDAKKLCFTERQASAILEMRLYKLIGLEILALQKAYKETLKRIPGIPPYPVQPEKHGCGHQGGSGPDPGGVLCGAEDRDRGRGRDRIPGGKGGGTGNDLCHGPVRLLQASGKSRL